MSATRGKHPRRARQGGFIFLIFAVGLSLIGTVALVGQMVATRAERATEARTVTQARLEAVAEAVIDHLGRTGRLPCPADGTQAAAATEVARDLGRRCALPAASDVPETVDGISLGTVPTATLGLSARDGRDGWGRRIAYIVFDDAMSPGHGHSLVQDAGMAFDVCIREAWLESQGNDDMPARCPDAFYDADLNFDQGAQAVLEEYRDAVLGGVGFQVEDGVHDPGVAGDGAAFVLISRGENGHGAMMPSGARHAYVPDRMAPEEVDNVTRTTLHRLPFDPDGFDDLVAARSLVEAARSAGRWVVPRAAQDGS